MFYLTVMTLSNLMLINIALYLQPILRRYRCYNKVIGLLLDISAVCVIL